MRNNISASSFLPDPSSFSYPHHLKSYVSIINTIPFPRHLLLQMVPFLLKTLVSSQLPKLESPKASLASFSFPISKKSPCSIIPLSSLCSTSSHYYCRLESQLPASIGVSLMHLHRVIRRDFLGEGGAGRAQAIK